MLTFLLLMESQNPDLARQSLSSQFLVSLESQDPDLARQSLFHFYFSTSYGMPEPRPRQTAPIQSVSRFFTLYLNLFSEPMHVCKPAHV